MYKITCTVRVPLSTYLNTLSTYLNTLSTWHAYLASYCNASIPSTLAHIQTLHPSPLARSILHTHLHGKHSHSIHLHKPCAIHVHALMQSCTRVARVSASVGRTLAFSRNDRGGANLGARKPDLELPILQAYSSMER